MPGTQPPPRINVTQESRTTSAITIECRPRGHVPLAVVLVIQPRQRPPSGKGRDSRPLPTPTHPPTQPPSRIDLRISFGELDHRQRIQSDRRRHPRIGRVLPRRCPHQPQAGLLGERPQHSTMPRMKPDPMTLAAPRFPAADPVAARRFPIWHIARWTPKRFCRIRIQWPVDIEQQQPPHASHPGRADRPGTVNEKFQSTLKL
jgi:hypothetical protein